MPRRMADAAFRAEQMSEKYAEHIAPINRYVDELREQGDAFVPYVAPIHGGVNARILSILRDPGPATRDVKGSGFLSVENDDGSAELQCRMLADAGLSASDLLPWNAYPWYIHAAPTTAQLDAGTPTILRLLDLAPHLRAVLLQGKHAEQAWDRLVRRHPDLETERGLTVVRTYHPSPQALFAKDPEERARRVARRYAAFHEAAAAIAE